MKLSDLVGLLNQLDSNTEIDVASIEVGFVDAPGPVVFITEELIGSLAPAQGILLR
jgi:hypothetical protein